MRRTEEEYIRLINGSLLFDIVKEDDFALYNSTKYEFITLLTEYYQDYIYRNKPLEYYDMELLETAGECIKGYDKSKGAFLNLFNSVMKRNMLRSKAKEAADRQRQGLTLSQRDNRLIRKILTYVKSKGADIDDEHTQKQIAEYLNLPIENVAELIYINQDAVAVSSSVTNDDGDEVELYDLQASKDTSPEDKAMQIDEVRTLLRLIESEFCKLQERTKPVMSKLLTAKFLEGIEDTFDFELLHGLTFIDGAMVGAYILGDMPPTSKAIAEEFGLLEASVSRTYKTFIQRIRKGESI